MTEVAFPVLYLYGPLIYDLPSWRFGKALSENSLVCVAILLFPEVKLHVTVFLNPLYCFNSILKYIHQYVLSHYSNSPYMVKIHYFCYFTSQSLWFGLTLVDDK